MTDIDHAACYARRVAPAHAVVAPDRTFVCINGMQIESPNRRRGMTRGGIVARSKRDKAHALDVYVRVLHALSLAPRRKVVGIHCVRVAGRRMDDDNVIAGFKRSLDQVAKALGVDDRTFVIFGDRPGIRVTFEQRSEGRGMQAVVFELRYESEAT